MAAQLLRRRGRFSIYVSPRPPLHAGRGGRGRRRGLKKKGADEERARTCPKIGLAFFPGPCFFWRRKPERENLELRLLFAGRDEGRP